MTTLALTLLLAIPCAAQTTMTFEPGQLREDFQIARQSLEEGQSGLYRYISKAELNRTFDAAVKSLDHPMDFYEFYRVMIHTVAALKSGHTTVGLSPAIQAEIEGLPRLPFEVKVLDFKAYIFRDYARDGRLAGKQIQSINGVPADRIIATMIASVSKDGDIQTSRQREIGHYFGENLITLLGLKAPYDVVLTGSGSMQLAGLRHEDFVRLSKTPSKEFAELEFLDEGKIAHINYPMFGDKVEEGDAFMKQSFESIQSKGTRALILDVRGNPGGEDELGERLCSYLIDKPFRYFDDIHVNRWNGSFTLAKYTEPHRDCKVPDGVAELRADGRAHTIGEPLLGLQQPSKPVFTGPVFVLIDGGSFSTTADFLAVLDFHHRATFIGEESGGGYYGSTSGSTARISLPNTKLILFIPMMDGYDAVGSTHDPLHGVIPDYPVKHIITDLVGGVDKDFELALELARKKL